MALMMGPTKATAFKWRHRGQKISVTHESKPWTCIIGLTCGRMNNCFYYMSPSSFASPAAVLLCRETQICDLGDRGAATRACSFNDGGFIHFGLQHMALTKSRCREEVSRMQAQDLLCRINCFWASRALQSG